MATLTSGNIVPLLKVKLYQKGAQPYFGAGSDRGAVWESIISEEARYGTYSYDIVDGGLGLPAYSYKIEYIGTDRIRAGGRQSRHEQPIGLVLHPYVIPQDIPTFVASSGDTGTWETLRPNTSPPKQRLCQVNPTGFWSRISSVNHPDNPDFCFTTLPLAVESEYVEATTGVAYSQIGWSNGYWAIRFFHNGNPILFQNGIPIMELASPGRQSHGDNPEEIVGIVRHQRGALMISMDHGASYDVWWDPDPTVSIRSSAGAYTFSGQGCAASLGLHQVRYVAGYYDSPANYMDRSRSYTPNRTYVGVASTLYGYLSAAIAVTNQGTSAYMKYRATLTPGTHTGHWTYYRSPELYTVTLSYPSVPTPAFNNHDDGAQFHQRILTASIEEPREIEESTFTMRTRWNQFLQSDLFNLRFRLIQVEAGWDTAAGWFTTPMFTGYITDIAVEQPHPNAVYATFTCQNTSLRAKRMRHRGNQCRTFDGYILNAAFVQWARDMGLDASYLNQHVIGDNITLPQEFPEKPAFRPVPGDERWEIMKKLADYTRMELGVARNGNYEMVQADSWNLTGNIWSANPVGESGYLESLSAESHPMESFTGVEVHGKNRFGEAITVWLFDQEAEENPASPRFKPWPEWDIITPEWTVTPQWLNTAVGGLAYKKLFPQLPVQWKGEFAYGVKRRDGVYIANDLAGVSAGPGFANLVGVLTMRHDFDLQGEKDQAATTISGIRLQ